MDATKDKQTANATKRPNQEQIYNDITSKDMPFHLIDDMDMTPQLQSRLEKDGYILERESQSGVWEISKASDKIAKDEVKSDGFVVSDEPNIHPLKKLRDTSVEVLKTLINKVSKNIDGREVKFTKRSLEKMTSGKAINKSLDNGFTREEHYEAAQNILEIFKTAKFVETQPPKNGSLDILGVHKYMGKYKNANIKITIKEIKDNGNRFYSIELLELLSRKIPDGDPKTSNLDNLTNILKGEEPPRPRTSSPYNVNDKTIPNQDLKSTDVANVSDEIGINKNRSGDLDRLQRKQLKNYEKDGAIAGTPAPATTRPNDGVEGEIIKNRTNAETIPNQNIKEVENLTQYRKDIEAKHNIRPIKEFGTNYAEFYHDGKGAINKLLVEKQGQVAGAFYDERFGDVGIVWGVEGTAKSDGWGIAKIAKYHPEALDKMEEMLKMPIIAQSENRIKLSDGKYFMSIRKDFNGEKQNWVLTAFEKEESKSVSGRRTNLSATQSASEKTTSQNTHTANSTPKEIKSQEPNLSRAERRAMGIEEPKGKTLVIDEKAVKNDVREFGRLAHQVGLGFKSAKEAKAVMDKCDKSKFDCGS